MRTLTRLMIAIALVASCDSSILDPTVCTPSANEVIIEPDSLHLVIGTFGEVMPTRWNGCVADFVDLESLAPTVRDPAVATLATHPALGTRVVVPASPGRTHLVLDFDTWTDSVEIVVPDTVEVASFTSISAGGASSCGVSGDGSAMCWGYGVELLGSPEDGTVGQCWGTPCSPAPVARMADATRVWSDENHACALDSAGDPWCWGNNGDGQVSPGAPPTHPEPVLVSGAGSPTALALGRKHTCGISATGEATCWGANVVGQLGRGDRGSPAPPTSVTGGHEWASLGAVEETTCAATTDGALYCWGTVGLEGVSVPGSTACTFTVSGKGGTSLQTVRCSTEPLRVAISPAFGTDTTFVAVSGRCALGSQGTAGCYDLGAGELRVVASPVAFASLAAGPRRACALTPTGEAWCWGDNLLGDGTAGGSGGPVAVAGGHVFTEIAVGVSHSCGLTVDEDVWCWGLNSLGPTGTSILEDPTVPVRVRGQG